MAVVVCLFFVGCGGDAGEDEGLQPTGNDSVSVYPFYPHLENWKDPENHGPEYQRDEQGICLACHSLKEGAPDCKTCHELVPHDPEWGSPEKHGAHVLAAGEEKCATSCHGVDLAGGISQVSCRSCHEVFPHPANWPSIHGETMVKLGPSACQSCHGTDFKTVLNGKNCASCHPQYPHPKAPADRPPSWINPALSKTAWPHQETSRHTMETGCALCHDLDSTETGGGGPPGCQSCHASFPHGEDWKEKIGHGVYVVANGFESCRRCHGEDFMGGISRVSCYSCHTLFPHPRNWDLAEQHGKVAIKNGSSLCRSCHGDDFSGGPSQVSCRSHHASYPHPEDWAGETEEGTHGLYALENTNDLDACAKCHGDDFEGENTGVNCTRCHNLFPHNVAGDAAERQWALAVNHGPAAENDGKENCRGCHGNDLTGANSGISCVNSSCHNTDQFPHPANWRLRENHGAHVATLPNGEEDCATSCHGVDLEGGLSGVSCRGCHEVYPHPRRDPATGLSDWIDPANRGNNSFHGNIDYHGGPGVCSQCHGSDFGGEGEATSCFDCHEEYPHTGENWVAIGMGNLHAQAFVGRVREGTTRECTRCHGENYDRVLRGTTSCLRCHEQGITHRSVAWMTEGSGHGSFFSEKFTSGSDDQFCKDCHGAPVAFSDGTQDSRSCPTCHFDFDPDPYLPERNPFQTRESLSAQSSCYSCHWAYPHVAFQRQDGDGELVMDMGWGPNSIRSGLESGFYFGHAMTLAGHFLATDEAGRWLGNLFMEEDPFAEGIVLNSCAGDSSGSCHRDVRRAPSRVFEREACSAYCHQ